MAEKVDTFTLGIPVTAVTLAAGQQLAATSGLVMRLKTSTFRGLATTYNIFAESTWGDPNNVVMAGAHLDSVNAGPGINDNDSGSAAILEVAQQMAKVRPVNKVRFALWGAEESGLVGSNYYVANLAAAERNKIALYLNFDMVGSPNHVFFVYDGDDSDLIGAGPGPGGSAQIEKTFEAFYNLRGLPFKGTDFSGRSDYGAFIANGFRPEACSPAQRGSRPLPRQPSGVAPPASPTTLLVPRTHRRRCSLRFGPRWGPSKVSNQALEWRFAKRKRSWSSSSSSMPSWAGFQNRSTSRSSVSSSRVRRVGSRSRSGR